VFQSSSSVIPALIAEPVAPAVQLVKFVSLKIPVAFFSQLIVPNPCEFVQPTALTCEKMLPME
jgi:hypothetical protein